MATGRPDLAAAPPLGVLDEVPRPCRAPGARVRRQAVPEDGLAVALSGGGFRASLAGLGVLRLLADAGLLGQVRVSSSVSGGSVANGLLATHYPALADRGCTGPAFDELVLRPFVELVSRRSLTRILAVRAWRVLGTRTRTDLLADELDRLLFSGRQLADLDPRVRFVVNAANTTTSARFGFEREAVGDYVVGELPTEETGLRLAQAVAASAAVPGLLAPVVLRGLTFPCDRGVVRLVDGGVYDNMGLEPVDDLPHLLVALNAGGVFRTGRRGRVPLVRDLQLAQSLLYRQTTALRRREMVERFLAYEQARDDPPPWGRRGVLFQLTTTMGPDLSPDWEAANPERPDPARVAFVATSFDRFPVRLCRDLVHAGWWLAGATLATYHRDVLGDRLPVWRELS